MISLILQSALDLVEEAKKDNATFDWNCLVFGITRNQTAYLLSLDSPHLRPPPPRINIQLYVGLTRAHQREIKYSGEAGNGYHGVSLVREDFK